MTAVIGSESKLGTVRRNAARRKKLRDARDFRDNLLLVGLNLLDIVKALAELDGLLGGNGTVDGSLYFLHGRLAALMQKRGQRRRILWNGR